MLSHLRPYRTLSRATLTLTVYLCLSGCYALKVGYNHTLLFTSQEPVEKVLLDPSTPDDLKHKLQTLNKVLDFAEENGLQMGGSYRSFIDNKGKPISYTVQVAEPYKLKWLKWWYPFVGSVPYRGYFVKEDRDEEAKLWEEKNYDVAKGSVSAFSGLGWFDDPIYASMLRRNEAFLADLIFHELTHRHVWLKGSVKFNENLASFVGAHLTEKYLLAQGKQKLLDDYRDQKEDRKTYRLWLRSLKKDLKAYYKKLPDTPPQKSWAQGKKNIFDLHLKKKAPTFRKYNYIGKKGWNNARVLSESLYLPDLERFEKAYKCSGHSLIGDFLTAIKERDEISDRPLKSLDYFCKRT